MHNTLSHEVGRLYQQTTMSGSISFSQEQKPEAAMGTDPPKSGQLETGINI